MNMKNLAMWAVIVFLTIGLYNMFKNPQANVGKGNSIIFSEFLSEVDNGGVVKVDIQGNNIRGVLANGNTFSSNRIVFFSYFLNNKRQRSKNNFMRLVKKIMI